MTAEQPQQTRRTPATVVAMPMRRPQPAPAARPAPPPPDDAETGDEPGYGHGV
jgi:hypothetical protein